MNFPRNIIDFQRRFSNENACWNYLRRVRWPHGFVCPYDGTQSVGYTQTRGVWQCEKGHQISVTTDTVMHGSHVRLHKWFWAAYLVSTSKRGISALELHEQIGVHYETAYMMLQRLRAGMVCPERQKISGVVEMDEAYVSAGRMRSAKRRKIGRGSRKPIVVCAVQSRGRYAGQVRLRRIPSPSAAYLERFALDYVTKRTTVVTD